VAQRSASLLNLAALLIRQGREQDFLQIADDGRPLRVAEVDALLAG